MARRRGAKKPLGLRVAQHARSRRSVGVFEFAVRLGMGKVFPAILAAGGVFLAPSATLAASAKRGIAYDLASPADLKALSPGVTWWYNWASTPNGKVPADYRTRYRMDYYPMLWNGDLSAPS